MDKEANVDYYLTVLQPHKNCRIAPDRKIEQAASRQIPYDLIALATLEFVLSIAC